MASTPDVAAAWLLTAAEHRGVTRLLRSALGDDRVLTDADVGLLATPAGPGSTRPPDRSKCSGKDTEGQVPAQVGLLAARGLLQLWLYDKPAL